MTSISGKFETTFERRHLAAVDLAAMKSVYALLLFVAVSTSALPQSQHDALLDQNSAGSCRKAAAELAREAMDVLHVKALSAQPTDGTYADEGYGQGEFDSVKLLEVLKSPIRWGYGHVFWVHPFPGKRNEQENLAPEQMKIGKRYFLVYTYYLEKEPTGKSQLIGLTRCGVLEDTPGIRAQLLDGIRKAPSHDLAAGDGPRGNATDPSSR